MPIFNVNGKRYKVREEDIAKFATDYPDAYTVIEDQGVRYGVKPADYKAFITPKGTTHSPTASHAPEDFLDADLRDPAQVEQKQLEEREAEFERDINRFGVDNIPSTQQPQQPAPVEQPQKTNLASLVPGPMGTINSLYRSGANTPTPEAEQPTIDEQELADMSATREQVAGMQDFVQGKINDNRSLGDFVPGQMGMLMTMSRANTKRRKDLDAYSAANDALRNAQRIIDEADRNGADGSGNETSFVGGALRGFGQKVFDPTTWDMGLSEMANSGTLLEALDVADSGGELTEAQRTLLDAKAVEMATNAYFGSYLGYGYKAGQVSAESIPFMLEMAINPAAALGKGASAKLTRYALKRYGKEAIRKNAAKYLATKAATRVGADVVGAATMTATTGALGTTADALRRMSGDIEYDLDENGRPIYGGHTEGDDALRAWYDAIMAGTIERASEMAGGYIAPIGKYTGLSKLSGDVVRKITPNGVLKTIDNMSYNDAVQFITNLERKAQWNGVVGEFGEEIYGGILNSYLVGDQTRDTDENTGIFNRENLIETFLGVGLMGGFFSTVKTGAYAVEYPRAKRRLKRADVDAINAFGSADLWGTFKEQLASTDALTRGKAVREILADANLTPEQKKAAVTYVGELQRMDGVRIGLLKHQIDAATPAEEVEVEQSFENGYTLQTPQEKNDARTMLEECANAVRRLYALPEDTDVDEFLGENPLASLLESKKLGQDDSANQIVLNYLNAKSTVEGMYQAVRDDIDGKIAQSDAQVDSRISQTDGKIHPATMKQDDRAVYIMSGEVVLLDDGTIDTANSSESIIVKDAETGKMEFSDPASLLNVGEVEDAEQTKEALREQIRQSVAGQAEAEILGTLAFAQGDTYVLTDEEGVQHQAQIVADNGDGTVQVALDGATEAVQMPKEQVQAMNDATNRGRAAAYIEQQNAQRESAMQEVAEEQQPIEEQPIEQTQEPQVEESALSRIPTDENGNQLFEQAPAQDTWSALVELNDGDTTEATDTAQQMLDNAKKELDKATSVKPKGGATVAEIQQDKAERKARIAEAQQKVDYWTEVLNAQQAVQEQAVQEVAQTEEVEETIAQEPNAGIPQTKLNNEEIDAIVSSMEQNAAIAPEIELTPENWVAEFGEDGVIETPIGEVKMGENQYFKLAQKGRESKLGMIKPTLQAPDIIVEERSSAKDGQLAERNSSYVFVKAFTNADGTRTYKFTSVTIRKEGREVVISNQEKETPRIKRLLKEGMLTYISEATLPSEPTHSTQGDQQTIPSGATLSDSKDTTSEPKNQEVEQEISQEEQIAPQEVAEQTLPATEQTAQETQAEAVPTQEQTEQEEQKQRKQQRVRIKVKKDEEARRKPLRKRAQAWAKKVGVEAVLIERFEDVENESARKAIQMHEEQKSGQRIPGWYSGGKVYIYLPHATDISDLDQTYIHEVVAHHGMKKMLGEEGYNQFCLKVWDMMEQTLTERELNRWLAYPGVKGDKAKAGDEYIAHLAETTESLTELDQSVWDKIVELIRDALRQLGVSLEGDAVAFDPSVEFTNKLIVDALHASKRNLKQTAKTATTKEKAKTATPKAQKVSDPKIEDFGEKIGGARKDVARGRLRDTAKLSMKDLTTLKDPDKILSRKDIVKFMQEGLMTEQDAMTLMALNAAARSKWTVRKGRILQKYRDVALQWERGEQVKVEVTDAEIDAYLAGMNESWRSQPNARKKAQADLLHSILVPFEAYHSTYEKLNYPSVYRNLKGTVIKEYHSGKYFVQSELGARRGMVFNSLQQAIDYVEKAYPVVSMELSKPKSGKADSSEKVGHLHVVKDSLYGYRIKSRSIPGNIFLSGHFRTKAEAEAYLQENAETLRSREEQMIFTLMGSDIGAVERSGVDYRQGRDITPEEFQSTFGFRGVEFGNWVPQAERQLYLNKTYDAIMDFCKVVGISPKAFSLGGQLALAFGSRGKSKAIAHYEPMKMAINLTRMNGAGSLAHEWFHALDNYLARQATGNALDMATDKRRAERDIVANTFSQLVRRMATLDYSTRSRNAGAYWNEVWERAARLFETYVYNELGGQQTISPLLVRETTLFDDTLVEDFGQAYPYPSAEENAIMKPYFDALFGALEERTDEQGNSILFRTVENDKARQFAIIERSNPMLDDYHTGIRSVEDIRTFDEAVAEARTAAEQGGWEELASYPDITNDMLEEAQQSGRITIYSSKPIANGTFVTPSLMQASDYAGGEEVYSKVVRTSDVAWINTDEGQMAASEDVRFRTTYHGTPATFERFDHSFMGSGEGNRVFGWGTYVTEEKGIGEWYAKVLTDPINEFSTERRAIIDAKIELDKAERFAESLREEIQFAKDNIAFFEERIRNGATGYELEEAQENIENSKENTLYNEQALKNAEAKIESARAAVAQAQEVYERARVRGNVYQVEIPDDNGYNYLSWEGRLTPKQMQMIASQAEKEGLTDLFYRDEDSGELVFNGSMTSGEFEYKDLERSLGSDKAASEFLSRAGFTGIMYFGDGGNQDVRNYVIFNDADLEIKERTSFRTVPTFLSNAAVALEGIKQEKATPQQWLAMLKKAGGIKAGEDKWIGLSEWLEQSEAKSLTKQEVLDYINENQIQIEETTYSSNSAVETTPEFKALQEEFEQIAQGYEDEVRRNIDEYEAKLAKKYNLPENYFDTTVLNSDESKAHSSLSRITAEEIYNAAWVDLVDRYGDDFEIAFWRGYDGIRVDNAEVACILLGLPIDRPIYHLREDYTTKGLEGNREIALTVPTIEPWNENDEVHFGDAGEGRTIAWIRFGETTDEDGKRVLVIDEIQSKRHQDGREKGYRPSDVDKYLKDNNIEVVETGEFYEFYRDGELDRRFSKGLLHYNIKAAKDLYVAGYEKSDIPEVPFEKNWAELAMKRMLRYAAEHGFDKVAWTKGDQQAERYHIGNVVTRILSYEGQDNGQEVKHVEIHLTDRSRRRMTIDNNGVVVSSEEDFVNAGTPFADVVGKEVARKVLNGEGEDATLVLRESTEGVGDAIMQLMKKYGVSRPADLYAVISAEDKATLDAYHTQKEVTAKEIDADGLRIGGEGMRAFYDQMLPSFMRKYAKKWGATVQDVTLPNVEEAGRTMHSVDVTDSMRESVMQGQTMFRVADAKNLFKELEERYKKLDKSDTEALNKWRDEKAAAIQSVLTAISDELGFEPPIMVFNGGIDTQEIADYIVSTYKDDVGVDVDKDWVKSYIEKSKARGLYWPQAGFITSDVSNYDESNDVFTVSATLMHENTHHLVGLHFDKRDLEAIWDEAVKANHPLALLVEKLYKGESNAKKGNELLAFAIGNITKNFRNDLFNYIKGRTVSEENLLDKSEYSLPLGRFALSEILNIYRNDLRRSKTEVGRGDRSANRRDSRVDRLLQGRGRIRRKAVKEAAELFASQLGTPINIVERISDITAPNPRLQSRKRAAKGWYDATTKQVVVVLPNAVSVEDVRATIFHEVVGHKGMRETVGEKRYNAFLEKVYRGASQTIRERIARRAATLGWDFNLATDEYLASLAEQGFEERENRNFFEVVRDLFLDLLSDAKIALGYRINDNDIRYMLWRTYQMQRSKGAMAVAEDVVMQQRLGVGEFDTRFRVASDAPITYDNFYESTEAVFTQVERPDRPADYVSRSGSEYWYGNDERGDYVIRGADHWSDVGKSQEAIEKKKALVEDAYIQRNDNKVISWRPRRYTSWDRYVDMRGSRRPVASCDWSIVVSDQDTRREHSVKHTTLYGKAYLSEMERIDNDDIRFRETTSPSDDVRMRVAHTPYRETLIRQQYEERIKSGMYQSMEAMQDSMQSLHDTMLMILKEEGYGDMYIEDVASFENAYIGENRLSSTNLAEANAFANTVFQRLVDAISAIAPNEEARTELIDYMFAKHGLERNEKMAEREAKREYDQQESRIASKAISASGAKTMTELIAEKRQKDYAGLTALTGKKHVSDAEKEAQRMVEEYENSHETDEIWERVQEVRKAILSKLYEGGLLSKEQMEQILDMYDYYIPLRGFDEKTVTDQYAYLTSTRGSFSSPIRKAGGRESKADDPFANLSAMAESAILQANRNMLVKQRFLNFVLRHPSDLVSVNRLWLRYDEANQEWVPEMPNILETDSPEEVARKVAEHEQAMKELSKAYPDRYKVSGDQTSMPYKVPSKETLKEHQVIVKRNGVDYVLTINGSPRLAQALNGLTNPDNDISGAIGAVLNAAQWVNRGLSYAYTTRNPDFLLSNFMRDMLYTNQMVWIKESPNYALTFHKNYLKANPVQMKILYSKYREGTLDMSDPMEAMFYKFVINGGETGYVNLRDVEQHKSELKEKLDRSGGKLSVQEGWQLLGDRLDEFNQAVENCARFAAFMTSQQMGRSLDRSIYDAKEISINFNKKGAGAKFMGANGQTALGNAAAFTSGFGRSMYIFWNAAIQGTTNFGRQVKRHPAKAFTAVASWFILGALMAYLGYDDDDEDAKNSYFNNPEYVRRSNIMFHLGDGNFAKIPLPIEVQAVYGLGELMVSAMSGKEDYSDGELASAIVGQMTKILPIDFMEGRGGFHAFIPSAAKTAVEASTNTSWTGLPIYKDTPYNKDMPNWTKAYSSTNKYLVNLAATLNELSGGDKYTKGAIDLNPAIIEYLLNGYFGGYFATADKLTKTAEMVVGARDFDPRGVLFLNRVLAKSDDRTQYRAVNNKYYEAKKEYETTKRRLRNYEHDTDEGIFNFAEKINFLYNSEAYRRMELFDIYRGDIEDLEREIKEATSDEEKEALNAELMTLKSLTVDAIYGTEEEDDNDSR
ncbi:MAG: hypothetical protein IJN98_06710 [Alistipes sp.]|nr:hypothetical protein [Alistipes sp.]